jgi:hypothetical protein
MQAKTLRWLLNFTDTDLANNRGLQNLILTKIVNKFYIVATDGHAAIFWKVDPQLPILNLDKNLCVYFDKRSLTILKNISDNVDCFVDFYKQTWRTLGGITYNCNQLRDCNIDFQNWLQFNFTSTEEMEDKDKYQHIVDLKDLSKFNINYKYKKLIIYPLNKRILLVKIPNELDKFGFICKIRDDACEISQEFEEIIETFEGKLKQEIKEKLKY